MDGVRAEGGADGGLLQEVDGGGQSAGAEEHGEVLHALLGDAAAGDVALIADLALDDGDFLDTIIEDDGHVLTDVGAGPCGEFRAGGIGQVEVDLGLIGIGIVAGLGIANVGTAPDGNLLQFVPGGDAALAGCSRNAGKELGIGRDSSRRRPAWRSVDPARGRR